MNCNTSMLQQAKDLSAVSFSIWHEMPASAETPAMSHGVLEDNLIQGVGSSQKETACQRIGVSARKGA